MTTEQRAKKQYKIKMLEFINGHFLAVFSHCKKTAEIKFKKRKRISVHIIAFNKNQRKNYNLSRDFFMIAYCDVYIFMRKIVFFEGAKYSRQLEFDIAANLIIKFCSFLS